MKYLLLTILHLSTAPTIFCAANMHYDAIDQSSSDEDSFEKNMNEDLVIQPQILAKGLRKILSLHEITNSPHPGIQDIVSKLIVAEQKANQGNIDKAQQIIHDVSIKPTAQFKFSFTHRNTKHTHSIADMLTNTSYGLPPF